MKKFVFACLFFLASCRGFDRLLGENVCPQNGPLFTVLVVGQSNGESISHDGLVNGISETSQVTVIISTASNVFSTEYHPSAAQPLNHSISFLHMGDRIYRATGRPVRIVNASVGGTTSLQWATSLKSIGYYAALTYQPDVILWIQGESDVLTGFTQVDTYNDLIVIFPFIKQASPNAKFYCAIDSLVPPTAPYDTAHNPIRAAEQQAIDNGYALQGPDLDALRLVTGNFDAQGIHFEDEGLRVVHGDTWFDWLKNHNGF